jgi:RepB plasmid partitioning protein
MSAGEVARMEQEMESLERDFRVFQDKFGENTLHLGAAQRYVRRLLENPKVKRYLQNRHSEVMESASGLSYA